MRTQWIINLMLVCFLAGTNVTAQITDTNQVKAADKLVEAKLLTPLKTQPAASDKKMFSRAYIGETYKYELYEQPSGKKDYYQGTLLEYRNQFITQKVEFRVYVKKQKVMLEDDKTHVYIDSETWIKNYKSKKD